MKKKATKRKPAAKRPSVKKATGRIAAGLRPLAEPIDGLVPDPQNPRTHDEPNIGSIAASLRRYGQRTPLVVNRTGRVILKGNGTHAAALRLGWTELAVVWVKDDATTATGYALADNRTGELAGWDDALLLASIATVRDSDADLADALLLDQLLGPLPEPGDAEPEEIDIPYGVVVTCADEEAQVALLEEFTERGLECRALL